MARIDLEAVAHAYHDSARYPDDYALQRLDLTWDDGGAYALLGPSGCGKTTLLNIISGLVTPRHGRVLFDDVDVSELPTERRNIAQIFQFPVIYDTMTVYANLAFPLHNRHIPRPEIDQRVRDIAARLGVTHMLKRKAAQLDAYDQQKIALGRGLVRQDVGAILFDEPLTVIDPHAKWQLRSQLKQLHQDAGFTMVYVTHDQIEALTFADKVVVMSAGQVVQVGTPRELFEAPAHTFVGYFIGSPGMNVAPCRVQGAYAYVGNHALPLRRTYDHAPADAQLEVGVRPEFLGLARDGDGPRVSIRRVEDLGHYRIARVALGDRLWAVKMDEDAEIPSDEAYLTADPGYVNIYADSAIVRAE